jgi:hypothetical protein
MSSSFSPLTNPFTRSSFWGREKELSIIWGRLLSKTPQSVVVIGEPYIGKSRLVKRLMESPPLDEMGQEHHFPFVYLDCKRYIDLIEDWGTQTNTDTEQSIEQTRAKNMDNFASACFWWDLYNALPKSSQANEAFPEPRRNEDDASWLDVTYEISLAIEKWIQHHDQTVAFILDNFEGVARLPLRNSDRLRSIGDRCVFILTSRYALYVLNNYHEESWAKTSPFYNIFSDPIYLGLLPEGEVSDYLEKAAQVAEKSGSHWHSQDRAFIRKVAGRHPELLRLACSRMFEERLSSSSEIEADEQTYRFLTLRLVQDASLLCKRLWEGLANPELYGLVGSPRTAKKEDAPVLSPYQSTLLDIAHGCGASDTKILFELEQRGLIERANGKWCVFSEALQQFVFMQEEAISQANTGLPVTVISPTSTTTERADEQSLTYLEGKVYDHLKTHLGEVCDKTEIMRAVWGEDDVPSQSALQKIIERIREKIEDDPNSPYKLIAVRGRGYMLRKTS